MSTYAIGDVQGCYTELQKLLEKIKFDPHADTLWFTGDLVNRGPESLATLRFIKSLGKNAITVLGNHDLHLIAIVLGTQTLQGNDTFRDILHAKDCLELVNWLSQQPLLHHDQKLKFTITHAGIAPFWDLATAQQLAHEVETVLRSESRKTLLAEMYGNEPACWNEALSGTERLRCIINYFTRMRFCDARGCLNLSYKGTTNATPKALIPWFNLKNRNMQNDNIIFGHWAALQGHTNTKHVFALDTGCVWGKQLTAMCLETTQRVNIGK
jgi:bis(5'-nucleosyl)-tetraphosphatase (symmetrical)